MTFLDRLERRFRRFAIPNLTVIIIVGQAILYAAQFLPQGVSLDRISLDPGKVLEGEWWRVFTFMFTPPATRPLFIIFYFLLLHLFGTTLEQQWGAFRYNLFLLIGWLASVAAAFVAWFIIRQGIDPLLRAPNVMGDEPLTVASNGFLYSSLFLAFARLYPDFIINLFFILPIRIKWLALLQWCVYALILLSGHWMSQMLVLATILNYLLFFGREHWRQFRSSHRRQSFQMKAKKATGAPRHECRVCGLSSDQSPRTMFRYCSKCAGQVCYCPEHIRDHEHVAEEAEAT